MALTATQVKAAKEAGRYGDGGGLYLNVAPGGSKAWMQRITIDGKRRDLGLGGYPAVSLAKAREKARDNKSAIQEGLDPTATPEPARAIPTFEEAALATHAALLPTWRSSDHSEGWLRTLRLHVFPAFGRKRVDEITRADVLDVLAPVWTIETGRRLRQRIRSVFKWCLAYDYVFGNPAGEILDGALPPLNRSKTHWRALPYADLADALETVRGSTAGVAAKLAFEFLTLTAARSGEVRGATWKEIDLDRSLWVIPGDRMKSGKEHRVPLSGAALDVLRRAAELRETGDYLFPSPQKAKAGLSDMTMTKILRSTGLADRMTVHGIRSSFRDWVAEQTSTPSAVAEMALAHAVGNAVEQAYLRSDLLDRRRGLMEDWASFLGY